jgi:NADPH:quinone reductase-like Zn-dependent oxidoreductase
VTGVDTAEKLDLVRSIGADHVIDYRREDFTRGRIRYDRIIDVAAYRSMFDYRRALSSSGVYILIGGASSRILQAATVGTWVSLTERRKMKVLVYTKPRSGDLLALSDLLAAGTVVPVIDRVVGLSDTSEAFRTFGQGHVQGKLVISCVPEGH